MGKLDLSDAPIPELFAAAGEGPDPRAPGVDQSANRSRMEGRSAVLAAATGGNGQFWPRRAVDYISRLRSHAARAQAFAEVPSEYQLMVARLLHRMIVGNGNG